MSVPLVLTRKPPFWLWINEDTHGSIYECDPEAEAVPDPDRGRASHQSTFRPNHGTREALLTSMMRTIGDPCLEHWQNLQFTISSKESIGTSTMDL
jgi:hypothetical protein